MLGLFKAILVIILLFIVIFLGAYFILPNLREALNEEHGIVIPKKLTVIPLLIVGLLLILSSVYTVSDTEQAVITMFGKVQSTQGAGLHFKLPILQKL